MESLKQLLSKKTIKRDQPERSMAGDSSKDKRVSGWVQGFNCVYRNKTKGYPFRVAVETSNGWVRKNDVSDLPTAAYIANILILAYDDRGKYQLNPFDGANADEVNAWAHSTEGKAACDIAGSTYAKQLLAGLQKIFQEVERVPPEHVSERLATAKQALSGMDAAIAEAVLEKRSFGFVMGLATELDTCVAELDAAFAENMEAIRAEAARAEKARKEAERRKEAKDKWLRDFEAECLRSLEEKWHAFMKAPKGDYEKHITLLVLKLGWSPEKGSRETYVRAAEKFYFLQPRRYETLGVKALRNLADNVLPKDWPHYGLVKLFLGDDRAHHLKIRDMIFREDALRERQGMPDW